MDRHTIIKEALALAQETGLDTLSFRKLANRLEVKAPSLYWHVSDKNDLLAAMGEMLLWQCLDSMPEVSDWPGWLRAFGRQLWLTQLSVRDSGSLLMTLRSKSAGTERLNDEIVARLAEFGVPPGNATVMQWSVQTLMAGSLAILQITYSSHHSVEAASFDNLEALISGWSVLCAEGFPPVDYLDSTAR